MKSFLRHRSSRSRHQGTGWRRVLLFEVVAHLLHRHKLHPVMLFEMFNEPVDGQHLRKGLICVLHTVHALKLHEVFPKRPDGL